MGRTLRNFENKPLTQNNDIVGVYNARKNSFEQFTDYYPYGMPHASISSEAAGAEVNRRKFGGKELMSDHGYNSYDFAARHQNPAFPHFTTPDPLAEKFKHLSPHLFCAGDPINHIDPTGMDYLIRVDETTITIKANIYTVANSLESAKFAAKQWNDLSNKYEMDGKIIKIEINVILIDPDSTHYKNTTKNKEEKALTYMASIDQNSIGNVFLISTDFDDITNGSNMGGNLIKVKPSRGLTETGAHEIGHTLGLNHYNSGLMTPSSSDSKRSFFISKNLIIDIIKRSTEGQNANNSEIGVGRIESDIPYGKFNYKIKDIK